MRTTRVLLVASQAGNRNGTRNVLAADSGIEVVGEVGDARRAVEAVRRLGPHVVVMNLGPASLSGSEVTRQIAGAAGGPTILVVSSRRDDASIRRALHAGAKGYLLEESADVELVRAVRSVARGGSYFSPPVSKVVLAGYLSQSRAEAVDDPLVRLTGREREVLQLICEGKTNKEIARALMVSINTVESHRRHVMEKLDLHNTAEMVRFAVQRGVVQ